ncbi:CAP family protein [Nocardia sp. NPDC058633]|uniref:CAP family protein n=1 Tax=Nocardia sp. NPDC058633 TaxID=3346568 RepID=UPI0036490049
MRLDRVLSAAATVLLAAALTSTGTAGADEQDKRCVSPTISQEMLTAHNKYRARHSAPPLVLDATISTWAQEWADHLARTDQFAHRTQNKYGENLYMSWVSDPSRQLGGETVVQAWYNEIRDYDFNNPDDTANHRKAGHFTQTVWKSSRQLGIGASCYGSTAYVVANYAPTGNIIGQFAQNVGRLG